MAKFTTMTTRRRWSVPLLLLAPTLLVMAYAFVAPLLTFFEYSFYRFRRGRLEQVFTLDTYSRFLFDEQHVLHHRSAKNDVTHDRRVPER